MNNPFVCSTPEDRRLAAKREKEWKEECKRRTGIGVGCEPVHQPKDPDIFWSWAADNFYSA